MIQNLLLLSYKPLQFLVLLFTYLLVSQSIINVSYLKWSNSKFDAFSISKHGCKINYITYIPYTSTMDRKGVNTTSIIQHLWNLSQGNDYMNCIRFTFAYEKRIKYITLFEAIQRYKVNNTILLMLTDKGYISQFYNSYKANHLNKYSNLVVVCINEDAYNVFFINK